MPRPWTDVRERPTQLAAVPDGSLRVLMAEADGLNAAMLRTILEQAWPPGGARPERPPCG